MEALIHKLTRQLKDIESMGKHEESKGRLGEHEL